MKRLLHMNGDIFSSRGDHPLSLSPSPLLGTWCTYLMASTGQWAGWLAGRLSAGAYRPKSMGVAPCPYSSLPTALVLGNAGLQ